MTWASIAPNLICEQHPWLEWEHQLADGTWCAGPGMPPTGLKGLEDRAQLISNTDYRSFRALLFEVRNWFRSVSDPWPIEHLLDRLKHHVHSPSVDSERAHR